jgi:branched-chain amino acid transport system substrate-binding protein
MTQPPPARPGQARQDAERAASPSSRRRNDQNLWTRVLTAALVLIGGASVAGCGATASADNRVAGRRLTIYVSLPFDGPSAIGARAVLGGVELALDHARHRVGRYRIDVRVLNDATVPSRGWDPGQTSANARLAIANSTTIGYLGDLNSGATAVSIPLLNRAGIPQISPSSTAVGLTAGGAEASPGEPQKYYPTQKRTFARVVPSDAVQAAVQAELQRRAGCRKVVVLDDGEVDGSDAATSFGVAAKAAGLNVIDIDQFEPRATSYSSLAASVAQDGADCVLISALTQNNAALVAEQVARAVPGAQLFGWSSLAETTFTAAADGGIPAWLDPRMVITVAALAPADYPPAGRRFLTDYTRRYGPPQPYAIYGYEAMSLMLDAISRATHRGATEAVRSKVLAELFATRDRRSVLGTYSIDADGDTTLDRYGVYHVSQGRLVFWKAMSP